jgi:two-component system, OmpR family, response regulator
MVAMKKLLLVEDEIQILLGHILRAEGYEVDETGTLKSALYILDRRPFDLVVADAYLPDGTGMMVGDKAREKGIRTVIITGYAFRLPKEELARFPYLLKPLRPEELVRTIERELAGPTPRS